MQEEIKKITLLEKTNIFHFLSNKKKIGISLKELIDKNPDWLFETSNGILKKERSFKI